ncbi:MAG: dethiobiotin synthase [Tepidiformaceae bacterium]
MSDVFFITGTDTDVGKTVAASWLAFTVSKERKTALVKPMQTGSVSPELDGDEAFYKNVLPEDVTITTFSTYPEPLAPSIAARRSESIINFDQIVKKSLSISADHDISFFEGAGGLLVPITDSKNMADYAQQIDAQTILVARPDLGTLNHILLTIEAIEQRKLKLALLVISGFPDQAEVVHWENIQFLGNYFSELPILILSKVDLNEPHAIQNMSAYFCNVRPGFLKDVPIPRFLIPKNL